MGGWVIGTFCPSLLSQQFSAISPKQLNVILQFTYATLESLLAYIKADPSNVKFLQSMISELLNFYLDIYETKIDEKEGIEKEKKRVEVFSMIVSTLLLINGDDEPHRSSRQFHLFNTIENERVFKFLNQMI
ncbi:MAG: hypothetical protein ACMG6E_08555 [Candidatus Roizmanbacteria bacterium]